jgi:hypothetical protein
MQIHVEVSNAQWVEGCDDADDHDHPESFDAVVEIEDFDQLDELARTAAIHDALIEQCNCCIIDGDFDVGYTEGGSNE